MTYGWPADSIATSSAIRFDPLGAHGQGERFARASREAGESLYPIGMADEGAGFLGSTENGTLHLVRDRVEPLATSTDQALDRLVAAQAARSGLWTPGTPAAGHPFWIRLDTVETGTDAGRFPRRPGRASSCRPASPRSTTRRGAFSRGSEPSECPGGSPGARCRGRSSRWTRCRRSGTGRSSTTSPSRRASICTPWVCATHDEALRRLTRQGSADGFQLIIGGRSASPV
ncbi:hypothetical protein [Streptomyces sp. NPDC057002]|uniref:hypothetical protein n=1 Tax=Streptomyces sp. NPDC057002 TaxID=3345992 RepID=UPI003635561F